MNAPRRRLEEASRQKLRSTLWGTVCSRVLTRGPPGSQGAEPWKRASDQEKAPEETKGPKAGRDHHNKERRKDTNNNHPHDNRRRGYETTRLQCQ